jgi:hypothetical protein
MMAVGVYITLSQAQAEDDLLSGVVKQVHIDRANEEVENLARRRDAEIAEIKIPIDPYLRDFAIFFALERCAGGRSGNNPRSFNNNAEGEPYSDKRDHYRRCRLEMETLLTYEVITGTQQQGSDWANPTIPLYRN